MTYQKIGKASAIKSGVATIDPYKAQLMREGKWPSDAERAKGVMAIRDRYPEWYSYTVLKHKGGGTSTFSPSGAAAPPSTEPTYPIEESAVEESGVGTGTVVVGLALLLAVGAGGYWYYSRRRG